MKSFGIQICFNETLKPDREKKQKLKGAFHNLILKKEDKNLLDAQYSLFDLISLIKLIDRFNAIDVLIGLIDLIKS